MVAITRKVADLSESVRHALEDALGLPLRDEQPVTIQFNDSQGASDANGLQPSAMKLDTLPEWCRVYEGLSDKEIAALEETILTRPQLGRSCE